MDMNGQLPSRLTRNRKAVLDAICAHPIHLTAARVYDLVQPVQPGIAFATVYNALHYLVHAGLIAEVRQPDGVVAYDRNTAPHDHIICRRCGRLDDVPSVLDESPWQYRVVEERTGYAVEAHRVEYAGICPSCRALSAQL